MHMVSMQKHISSFMLFFPMHMNETFLGKWAKWGEIGMFRVMFFLPQLLRMADDFDVEAMLEAPYKKVGWRPEVTGPCFFVGICAFADLKRVC